jgi:CIC family chloride channel protein
MQNKKVLDKISPANQSFLIARKYFYRIFKTDYTIFTFYSVVIGIAVGLATVLFHESIEFFNQVFFEQTAEGLFFLGAAAVIVLPALGMFIQSIMIISAPETANKRGVAEVIKAVATKGTWIPFKTTLFHFLAPVISIGSGNTVGPEGPAAQLGGGVANKLAQIFNLSDSKRRVFTAAGSGAAIAAIFNTPLGGIFFALEVVMLNEFSTAIFPALILASVTASAVSRAFIGNTSVFVFSSPNVGEYYNLYWYAVLGIVAGFVSLFFIRYSNTLDTFFQRKILNKFPQWLVMTAVGLIVGVCGYFYKDLFGIGYVGINRILANSLTWQVVTVLFILKFLLVPLVLNSGGFGGIFAPSLFIGSSLGFLFGFVLNQFFGFNYDITAFVLVGMGAVLGGINSIPIAAILIIFEMTKDYSFILPLMLAVVTSTMVVQITLKRTTHERHLEKQGYRLAPKNEIVTLKTITVKEVMKDDMVLIPEFSPLPDVIKALMESPRGTFYIINENEKLTGKITESEIRPIITEYEQIREVIVARDLASHSVTTVVETDHLDDVMKLFESKEADEFPVLSSIDKDKIIGTISRQDVISAYNKLALKTDLIESFSHELKNIAETKQTKVFTGYSITETTAPKSFIGKSLVELKIRSKYGLEVLMVRKKNSPFGDEDQKENLIVPLPSYIIEEDDVLVLFGQDEKINALMKID